MYTHAGKIIFMVKHAVLYLVVCYKTHIKPILTSVLSTKRLLPFFILKEQKVQCIVESVVNNLRFDTKLILYTKILFDF